MTNEELKSMWLPDIKEDSNTYMKNLEVFSNYVYHGTERFGGEGEFDLNDSNQVALLRNNYYQICSSIYWDDNYFGGNIADILYDVENNSKELSQREALLCISYFRDNYENYSLLYTLSRKFGHEFLSKGKEEEFLII